MKVLLTGGSGMVGRNLLSDPRAGEHEILAPSSAQLDLTDGAATLAFLRASAPDAVIHAAGVVGGIQANLDEPARFLGDNLAMGLNLLRAARAAGVPRLVNLGSSCIYPKDHPGTLAPDLLLTGPLEPTNEGYAIAKLAVWKLTCAIGAEDSALTWRTLVPPNLYGRFDHYDPVRSHLMAAIVAKVERAAREGLPEVEIWGDGTARREFLFAGDLADFIWTHLDRLESLPPTMNVGSGQDETINAYYAMVADCVGWRGRFTHDLSRPVGMRRKLMDVSDQARLGWSPPTSLPQGIEEAVRFYRAAVAG